MNPRNPTLPDTHALADVLGRRVLLYGAMGTGKSTLAASLAARWAHHGESIYCISADPGLPAFGPPGAVALGEWTGGDWALRELEPLCTLDAARFRAPLLQAVARLVEGRRGERLVIDAPGVVRGVAGAELLLGLAQAGCVDTVLMFGDPGRTQLEAELAALPCPVFRMPAHPEAAPPRKPVREAMRTRLWDHYLASGTRRDVNLDAVAVIGTPPPRSATHAWIGRQLAVFRSGAPAGLGEVTAFDGTTLTLTLPASASRSNPETWDTLLLRDARRAENGRLVTAVPVRPAPRPELLRPTGPMSAPFAVEEGPVTATLVNGVLGDPLLELCLANVRERLLFDLGDAARLTPRSLHAVSNVFVSHAHLDHIGGFLNLLRGRLSGTMPVCRVYGPPGLHNHVAGFVAGICWDRIGDAGPPFEVAEIHGDRAVWERVVPGRNREPMGSEPLCDGVLLTNEAFTVRSVELDHGIPVRAYALEVAGRRHASKTRLAELGLPPGPWVGELKSRLAAGHQDAGVRLPDGREMSAGRLAALLVDSVPGRKIVYATDLADSPVNRRALAKLAEGADLLICESTFVMADAAQARRTHHLTTRACAEIATEAGVRRLLPFHFSRRYTHEEERVYDEVFRHTGGAVRVEAPHFQVRDTLS